MFNFRLLRRTEENVEIKKVLEGLQNELGSGNSSERKQRSTCPSPDAVGWVRLGTHSVFNESLEEDFPLLTEGLPEAPVIRGRLDHSR